MFWAKLLIRRMPRYYFDFDDQTPGLLHDDRGTELKDAASARREAIGTLAAVVRDALPDGQERAFEVVVRDEARNPIFRATLAFKGEWLHSAAETRANPS